MKQYLDVCKNIIDNGEWVYNERTGKRCLTIINADFVYSSEYPIVTTRKSPFKLAVGELLGYISGVTDALIMKEKYKAPSWLANANDNESWINNHNRKHNNDMGFVYGAVAKNWPKHDGSTIDLFEKVVNNLSNGIDDRGEIVTFWNEGLFDLGCLRPCMHSHQFSLIGDTLHLNSTQRSCDMPLGYVANAQQCYIMLALMAQITGHKAGKVFHKIVNAHIYEDQIELMKKQIEREPLPSPTLSINPDIETLDDIRTWVTTDDFDLIGYEHHEPIKYPFSV